MVTYTPVALCSIIAFAVLNLTLLPLAFAKAMLHKTLIVFRLKKKQYLLELLNFAILGLPVMVSG